MAARSSPPRRRIAHGPGNQSQTSQNAIGMACELNSGRHRLAVSAAPSPSNLVMDVLLSRNRMRFVLDAHPFSQRAAPGDRILPECGWRQKLDPRRQNRGFDHGVFRPIKSEEITQSALLDRFGDNFRTLVAIVDRDSLETHTSGKRLLRSRRRSPSQGRAAAIRSVCPTAARANSSTSSVTCKHTLARPLEILISHRRAIRPQQQPSEAGVDNRPHRRNVRRTIVIERRDDALEQRAVGQPRTIWGIIVQTCSQMLKRNRLARQRRRSRNNAWSLRCRQLACVGATRQSSQPQKIGKHFIAKFREDRFRDETARHTRATADAQTPSQPHPPSKPSAVTVHRATPVPQQANDTGQRETSAATRGTARFRHGESPMPVHAPALVPAQSCRPSASAIT